MTGKKSKLLKISFAIVLLLCISLLLFYYMSVNSASMNGKVISSLTADTGKNIPSQTNIKADVSVDKNIVTVKQEITFSNEQDSFLCYIPSANSAQTIIKQISSDGGISQFSEDGSNLYVKMAQSQYKLYIEYEITLEESDRILSYHGNKILLTDFLITPAVKSGNDYVKLYKSALGDPFIYEMTDYDVTVRTSRDYTVCGEGKKDESSNGVYKYTSFKADNHRDFSVLIAKNSSIITEEYHNIRITYVDSYDARAYVQNALSFGELQLASYPYHDFVVASVNMKNDGMEYSGMIFLNENAFQNLPSHKELIYHEIFHQWFYGVIGTDQLNEPYLDEGLVTFLAAYLTNQTQKYQSTDQTFLNMKLSDYSNQNQYWKMAYADSAGMIHGLYNRLGEEAFFNRLRNLFSQKSSQMVSYHQFMDYFQ